MKDPKTSISILAASLVLVLFCSCAKPPKVATPVASSANPDASSAVGTRSYYDSYPKNGRFVTGLGRSRESEIEGLFSYGLNLNPSLPTTRQRFVFTTPPGEEEIWVIKRFKTTTQYDREYPGSGSLVAMENEKEVPLPLKHTSVEANVSGYIAHVTVKQEFTNPFSSKIEAVYVFPLPENAAVNEFLMKIGSRTIRGIIRDREEAEEIYDEAKRQGYTAALLTQERPNIFTQSVANIEPQKQIDVSITYFNTLTYNDGWLEFVFPMVVGPRFNPPGTTQGVASVPRGRSGDSREETEVPYLRPNERSGHNISLNLKVNAGMKIEEYESLTHQVHVDKKHSSLTAKIRSSDSIPNKDFVFRYRLAGDQVKSGFITEQTKHGNFFSFMLVPPSETSNLKRKPVEMVFVLDCSGSMSGEPLRQAKEAIRHSLEQLQPDDTFQLINFSLTSKALGRKPLAATPANIRKALRHLESLNAEGGTMMIEGVKAALDFPHDEERLRFVCFLTDGYIGNEGDILAAVDEKIGDSRIFSFGVGTSVNRYLLDNMARLGRGTVAYLLPKEDSVKVMDSFMQRVRHPALTDIKIIWPWAVKEVYPKKIPDLFVGRAIFVTGKYDGRLIPITVQGKLGSDKAELRIPVTGDQAETSGALAAVWARAKIADLSNQEITSGRSSIASKIKEVALEHGLMSSYTAFIAVDTSKRTKGHEGTTVPVAVPVPEGVKYQTTVGGE